MYGLNASFIIEQLGAILVRYIYSYVTQTAVDLYKSWWEPPEEIISIIPKPANTSVSSNTKDTVGSTWFFKLHQTHQTYSVGLIV